MISTAIFSPCRQYRYTLTRAWDESKPACAFIGLNPSTADETLNDPTITRCINFAKRWGHGSLVMLNLFAFRATDPKVMKAHSEPVGPENDWWLVEKTSQAGIAIAAWGVHGTHRQRDEQVLRLIGSRLHCLGVTKDGFPKHPLYLKGTCEPQPYASHAEPEAA